VEANFYRNIAPRLVGSIPRPLLVDGGNGGKLTLVLEDLEPKFPRSASGMLDEADAACALRWLARYVQLTGRPFFHTLAVAYAFMKKSARAALLIHRLRRLCSERVGDMTL
jgi:hypothetical protein